MILEVQVCPAGHCGNTLETGQDDLLEWLRGNRRRLTHHLCDFCSFLYLIL